MIASQVWQGRRVKIDGGKGFYHIVGQAEQLLVGAGDYIDFCFILGPDGRCSPIMLECLLIADSETL